MTGTARYPGGMRGRWSLFALAVVALAASASPFAGATADDLAAVTYWDARRAGREPDSVDARAASPARGTLAAARRACGRLAAGGAKLFAPLPNGHRLHGDLRRPAACARRRDGRGEGASGRCSRRTNGCQIEPLEPLSPWLVPRAACPGSRTHLASARRDRPSSSSARGAISAARSSRREPAACASPPSTATQSAPGLASADVAEVVDFTDVAAVVEVARTCRRRRRAHGVRGSRRTRRRGGRGGAGPPRDRHARPRTSSRTSSRCGTRSGLQRPPAAAVREPSLERGRRRRTRRRAASRPC